MIATRNNTDATVPTPIIVDKSTTASMWGNNMPYEKQLNRAERRALKFKRKVK